MTIVPNNIDLKGLNEKVNLRGAGYEIRVLENGPLVSVLIRTYQRAYALEEALESIRKQTYQNIEVVIVEDGSNTAENILQKFTDLNIVYECLGEQKGRCEVGNRCLELASGDFLNFLDDDDLLFPFHVELLVSHLVASNVRVGYALALETEMRISSEKPYQYKITGTSVKYDEPFNRFLLFQRNYIPMQCIMFHRDLIEEHGKFDKELKRLQDWDLWLRFSLTDRFEHLPIMSSLYRVPAEKVDYGDRHDYMASFHEMVQKKYANEVVTFKMGEILQEVDQADYYNRRYDKYAKVERKLRTLVSWVKRKK